MTADAAVAADVDRLRADAQATLGRAVDDRDLIAIAVSGGPDSMVLLALAAAAWPGRVIAATVDHGLRAEAAAEAAMVAGYCAASGPGVPHATLAPAAPIGAANIQAAARTARYALLTEWAAAHHATILATAHHADDQAETLLMRAARGSGLAGLAGVRPRRPLADGMMLIRPLLAWRRAEVRAIADRLALPFVDDPGNASDRHDRTRFRALLGGAPWLDPAQVARAAGHLAEVDADLRAIEAWLLATRARPAAPPGCVVDVGGLPREMRRRLARAAIGRVRAGAAIDPPRWHDGANIEPLLDALDAGGRATQAGVMASASGDLWHFRPAPPRRGT